MSKEHRTIPVVRETAGAAKDCPLAPPEHASVYARTLHRACLIVGGIRQLAERLEVPEADVRRWLKGEDIPPEEVFVAAVEIVLLYAAEAGKA
jgi:hypothetical protein